MFLLLDMKLAMANKNACLQIFYPISFYFFLTLDPLTAHRLSASSNVSCIGSERKVLLEFKSGLKDPSGQLSSWVGEDCCQWSGVSCSKKKRHVIKLELSRLSGKINPSLLDLKYLDYLDLSINNFYGVPIPEFFGSLSKLSYLNLSSASFSGMVPPHLGNLSNLLYLDLSENDNIWVPDLHWITRFSHLKYLNLGVVDLSLASISWLQAINMIPSLSELHLPQCNLHNFPSAPSVSNLSSLQVIHLGNNMNLNTSIPQWLFNISSIKNLNLMNCQIKGSIADSDWRKLCSLQALDLSYNELSGEIDEFLGGLSECSNRSLQKLELWDNELSGQIPESIRLFKYLKTLWLGDNSFSGSLPSVIGNLSFLELFYLPANAMDGTIPDSIGQLPNLISLDLSKNSWKGVLSETHFLGQKKLETFRISSLRMSLSINIRPYWIPSFSLTEIQITDCDLQSRFPVWLKTQKKLYSLTLKSAAISGKLPDWIWQLSTQLTFLDLSGNQLGGEVPSSLKFGSRAWVDLSSNYLEGSLPNWSNVSDLNLDNNKFSGPITMNFCREMSLLTGLRLSGNLLNGSIPPCITELKNLKTLDLSKNRFSGNLFIPWQEMNVGIIDLSKNNLFGEIPSSICSLPNLHVLKLFSNHLSGELSLSLKNCKDLPQLSILDLGENKFTGSIPEWIGKSMPALEGLGLRGNMLSGNISEHLCSLADLHILDLAGNNLSGLIPSCFGNFSRLKSPSIYFSQVLYSLVLYEQKMELVMKGRQVEQIRILDIVNVIDLSRNNFTGEIPEEIANLAYLGSLNLSWNQFTGKIPENLNGLKLLETLDLSSNHLSGPIPPSMTSMTFLSHLNLSHNNLSGPIPTANQFRTFNDPSIYEVNSQLCGSPLPTNCSTSKDEDHPRVKDDEGGDEDWIEMQWFYIALAPGFVVGFWFVCGTLILKKSWRYVFYNFIDEVNDRIHLFFALRKPRLRRKLLGGMQKAKTVSLLQTAH